MKLTRATRRSLSAWLVGLVLIMQGLTAAYACPALEAWLAPQAEPAAATGMPGCHASAPKTMDPAQPSLCKAHCDAEGQAPAQAAAQTAPPPGPGWFFVLSLAPAHLAAAAAFDLTEARSGAPPGWPPIYLSQQVLRN